MDQPKVQAVNIAIATGEAIVRFSSFSPEISHDLDFM